MIRALDPKLNPATAEIQALRNQLGERDKQIVNLEVSLYYRAFLLFLFWTRTWVLFEMAASVWAGQTERIRREDDRHSMVQQGTVGLKCSLFLTSMTVSHRLSCLSTPSESELSEAGDGIPSGWLHLARPNPVFLVPATSSRKCTTPGTLCQHICHYLQVVDTA